MTTLALANRDRAKLARIADGLVIATAISLPWSTSATSILVALSLLAIIATLDWDGLRRAVTTPAGCLPLLLVALGIVGTLWADVTLAERWEGLGSFFKLAVIPLLFVHFSRSERAQWLFGGYLMSCVVLLLTSYALVLWPGFPLHLSPDFGVPVKNAATQSGEFATCIFGLMYLARERIERRQWLWAGILVAVALAMLANIFFVATGRTALLVILVLLAMFAVKQLTARGIAALMAGAIALGAIGWFSSPYLRVRVQTIWTDLQVYDAISGRNSSGERMEFAQKSIVFIREAPVIGHGTGSIHDLFTKSAIAQNGARGAATTNPHNQTFAVAIQLGLLGAAVLWAMWIAHLLLFRGPGLVSWIGLVVAVQNVVGSLANSHLFDFLQGWVYVLGVGVAGGVVLKGYIAAKPDGTAR